MAASIKELAPHTGADREAAATRELLTAVLADLAATRAAFVALTAKLDADGGVTDVDYASTLDPAALQLRA